MVDDAIDGWLEDEQFDAQTAAPVLRTGAICEPLPARWPASRAEPDGNVKAR